MSLVFLAWAIASTPQGVRLDVPFVRQVRDGCGSASIAMVMRYWLRQDGRNDGDVDPLRIHHELYDPRSRGITASSMEAYFSRNGFETFAFSGDWSDLHEHLEKGRPLIVALDGSRRAGPLHFVVVVGLDPGRELVYLADPARRNHLKLDRRNFEKRWSASDKYLLLVAPKPGDRRPGG